MEVLIGMNRDPQFGPLVTFGLGGIYVETLKDVTFRIAPFSRREAEEMLGEIRARALLDGVRGKPPVDKAALVDALLRDRAIGGGLSRRSPRWTSTPSSSMNRAMAAWPSTCAW